MMPEPGWNKSRRRGQSKRQSWRGEADEGRARGEVRAEPVAKGRGGASGARGKVSLELEAMPARAGARAEPGTMLARQDYEGRAGALPTRLGRIMRLCYQGKGRDIGGGNVRKVSMKSDRNATKQM